MTLLIASLNSGSNGNCYYIGNAQEAVLVDAGLSCRETEKRMKRLGLSINKVRAIFISHEHSDHIRGVEVIARKYRLPVYITPLTLARSNIYLEAALLESFTAYQPVRIGGLTITGFPKQHDAIDAHSFIIEGGGITTGVFTDIGAACENVVRNFSRCHAAFLEANYDVELLSTGHYPAYLKKRISGDNGHLSNEQALKLFTTHKPAYMSHLLLAHLSRDNNDPQLVQQLFEKHAGNTYVTVASRDKESAVYRVLTVKDGAAAPGSLETEQLSLFR